MKKINFINFRLSNLRLHVMPVLVWLMAIACVAVLFRRHSQRFEILGMAQGQVRQVASTCTGRLKSVPLELFQEVKKGDVVAVLDIVLDNEKLEAEMATISAQIQQLQAELVHTQEQLLAEAADRETDWIATHRRFLVDVENARLQVLELKAQFETDRIMLEDMELNTKISTAQTILDQNDVAHYQRQRTKVEYNALAKTIEETQQMLAEAESAFEQALQRRDEFARRQMQPLLVDSALEVIRKAIDVQEQQVKVLSARSEPLVLTSPIDGMVIQVLGRPRDVALRRPGELVVRRAGEVVLAGETILTIAETEPREIIAYASPRQLGLVRGGMAVQLIKNIEPAQIASSHVAYLGATLERMPECLWEIPNVAQWGHPMLIEIPPGLRLKPGELVGIRGI